MNTCPHRPTRVVVGVQVAQEGPVTVVLTCCDRCRPAVELWQSEYGEAICGPIEDLDDVIEFLGADAWVPVAV